MVVVDKENFAAEVLEAQGLVVVDFWSPKCEPCQALMPEVAKLAEKYSGQAKFCKLDTAANRRLAISQKVLGLPTIGFYRQGEKIAELTKEFTIEDVEAKLQALLP